MFRKIWLVAQREILENVRTKGFWIGILLMPIIMIGAIVLPEKLEKARSARSFAVVDHSGWLLAAIEDKVTERDLGGVLLRASIERWQDPEAFAELPQTVRGTVEQMPTDWTSLPAAERQQHLTDLQSWWRGLSDEEAAEIAPDSSRRRFRRVEVAGSGDELLAELNRQVAEQELFAYFVIEEDPVSAAETGRYVSRNVTDGDLRSWLSGLATETVRERRLAEQQISPEVAQWIQQPLSFTSRKVASDGAEGAVSMEDRLRQMAPAFLCILLWLTIYSGTVMLMTNTIEEKANRLMEVLLSSVSPLQLMAGKIAGVAATGLIMVASWALSAVVVARWLPGILGFELKLDLGAILGDPVILVQFIVYFFLGYLFYAALLVGIGSVCDTMKDAQNLMTPVILVLMVPMFITFPIAQDPNGVMARVLSYLPPFTPFAMLSRAAGPPTLLEYLVTTVLLAGSVFVVLWAAAKVFRVGVLMSGQPPTPREMLRWIKAPIGAVPVQETD